MIKPLFNNVLIEVIDEYEGIVRDTSNENVQKGKVISYQIMVDHLTASTGHTMNPNDVKEYSDQLKALTGKIVYWQEYADSGSKFEQDGKRYVLVPFYRLIGFEE